MHVCVYIYVSVCDVCGCVCMFVCMCHARECISGNVCEWCVCVYV